MNDTDISSALEAYDRESGDLNAIIETPKGGRVKFDYDSDTTLFKLGGMLPEGSSFPFNFGFIPSTLGADGDPLDVLVLMEEPAFTGCLMPARLIGRVEAEQTDKDGETMRNDRLIAIASDSQDHSDIKTLKKLQKHLIAEIEDFFVSYNKMRGKEFKPLGHFGLKQAKKLVKEGKKPLSPTPQKTRLRWALNERARSLKIMKFREETNQDEGAESGNRDQQNEDQTGKPQGKHGNKQDAAGQYKQPGADTGDSSSGRDNQSGSSSQ